MANDHSTLSLVQKSKKDSAAATIEVLSGPSDGMEFEIRDNEMIIGREINAHIALPLEISLSRIHARITARNDEFWLEDLNSKYGTYIGSQKVTGKVKLPPGVIFKAGECEMRIVKS